MNIDTNWHSWTPEMLYQGLKTDPARGLSPREAAKRISKNGQNRIWSVKRASAVEAALRMLLDLSTLLLLVVAVVAAVFEKTTELFAIIAIVVIGGGLRVFLHVRTQRIFEEKARGVIPRVTVIRNSAPVICSAENLAEGDVIVLFAGDTVPADARIISTSGVLVYENKMTDNKSVVYKTSDTISEEPGTECPIEKRDNMLFAGTTVVSGEARAVVVATGAKTLAASKFGMLMIPSGEKLKISDKLTKWSRVFSIAALAAVLLVTLVGSIIRSSMALEILLSAFALAAASMSESFGIIGTYALAAAVKKADSEDAGRAKVKDAASVEEMNRTDTILLESPTMIKAGDITLNSYFIGDRIVNIDEPVEGMSPVELLKFCYVTTGMLPQGALAPTMTTPPRESTSVDYAGIRKIFEEYFARSYDDRALENTILVGHEPAGTPESGGLDTALICREGNFEAVVSGSVEGVLSCCTAIRKGGRVYPIGREDFARIADEVEVLRRRGVYTVAVARRDSPYINMNRVSALQMCMTFEGFLALSDRAHGDALDAIRKCREGTECRMVCFTEGSGEDKAFLEMIGFLTENDRYITLEEALSSDRIILEAGQFAAVCTGSRDAAKLRRDFFRKLKRGGANIAYVSKDPDDMWLMKEAPLSVAVPAAAKIKKTIPQSIRSSSDVVVTPQNGGGVYESFRVVELARSAMLNLRRCANYLAASNVARLILVLVASFTTTMRPADPASLLIWGLLLDLAVAFVALRRDPPWNMISVDKKVHEMQSGLRDFVYAAGVGAIWALLIMAVPAALSAYTPSEAGTLSDGTVSNLIFVSALVSAPVVGGELMTNGSIFKRSKRRSRAIPALFALGAALGVLFAFSKTASSIVSAETLTFKRFILTLAPAVIALVTFEIIKLAGAKRRGKNEKTTDKSMSV